jgi:hypothetical protein
VAILAFDQERIEGIEGDFEPTVKAGPGAKWWGGVEPKVNPKEAGLNLGSGKPSRSGTELSSGTETETETGLRVRGELSAVFFWVFLVVFLGFVVFHFRSKSN